MENNIPLIDVDIAAKITGTPALKVETAEYKSKGPDKTGFYWGTGRRKSSVARVRIRPGKGALVINEKELDNYFPLTEHRNAVVSPLKAMDVQGKFDIYANVQGGGITGQAGAIMLGIARALKDYDIEAVSALRQGGYLTRDGRMKERKKYGQRGARRSYQFSKR
jgi:small subunit ribosomal protein S9